MANDDAQIDAVQFHVCRANLANRDGSLTQRASACPQRSPSRCPSPSGIRCELDRGELPCQQCDARGYRLVRVERRGSDSNRRITVLQTHENVAPGHPVQLDAAENNAPSSKDRQRVTEPGPEPGPAIDAVESALADALRRAADAGAWPTVERLASELEARRKDRAQATGVADVVSLTRRRS